MPTIIQSSDDGSIILLVHGELLGSELDRLTRVISQSQGEPTRLDNAIENEEFIIKTFTARLDQIDRSMRLKVLTDDVRARLEDEYLDIVKKKVAAEERIGKLRKENRVTALMSAFFIVMGAFLFYGFPLLNDLT